MEIKITPFKKIYEKECLDLIKIVVVDGFIDEGIDIIKEKKHLDEELDIQFGRLKEFSHHYFLAQKEKAIVGMIAYLQPCEAVKLAMKKIQISSKSIQEIVAVYIHPDYQRRGIGSQLFTKMLGILKDSKVEFFAVSTGYKKGRSFWTKKLGKESVVFPTYYNGYPCSIWIRKVGDI